MVVLSFPFIAGLFINENLIIVRDVYINKHKSKIIDYYKYVQNHEIISSFYLKKNERTYKRSEIDGVEGAYGIWESEETKVGCGKMTISEIDSNKVSILYDMYKPIEFKNIVTLNVDGDKVSSYVACTCQLSLKYPNNVYFLFIDFEKEMGDEWMYRHLLVLKKILEKK